MEIYPDDDDWMMKYMMNIMRMVLESHSSPPGTRTCRGRAEVENFLHGGGGEKSGLRSITLSVKVGVLNTAYLCIFVFQFQFTHKKFKLNKFLFPTSR